MQNFSKLTLLFIFISIGIEVFSQNWKRNISPMVGYRGIYDDAEYGGNLHMLEIGAAYVTGNREVSQFLGRSVLGWRYFGPFATIDGKFRSHGSLGSNAMMLNMGITAGAGGFFTSILPTSINGIFSYSTDFRNSYLRIGLGYDLCFVSIGAGVLSKINGGQFTLYDNQLYLEIRLLLWKNNTHY